MWTSVTLKPIRCDVDIGTCPSTKAEQKQQNVLILRSLLLLIESETVKFCSSLCVCVLVTNTLIMIAFRYTVEDNNLGKELYAAVNRRDTTRERHVAIVSLCVSGLSVWIVDTVVWWHSAVFAYPRTDQCTLWAQLQRDRECVSNSIPVLCVH